VRERFEAVYDAEVFGLPLRPGATEALDRVDAVATQSIVSMAPDGQLQALIDHHGIRDRFLGVEGSRTGSSDGSKEARLCRHLAGLGLVPESVVLIGDTVDDQQSAAGCGARSVMITEGSQTRADLAATGAPVVDTLPEAADLALSI
jgi:phosphoglycolate phosphatase-like HAD superfamily hydrolase